MSLGFVVLIGTAAPFGFSSQETACAFVEERGGRIFQFAFGAVGSCYAIRNGCEKARNDAERKGIQMREVECVKVPREGFDIWVKEKP